MEQTELLPCPFCGGINIVHCAGQGHMTCWTCGCEGADADDGSREAATAAWNARSSRIGATSEGLTEERLMQLFEGIDERCAEDAVVLRMADEGARVDPLELIGARHEWRAFVKAARAVERECRAAAPGTSEARVIEIDYESRKVLVRFDDGIPEHLEIGPVTLSSVAPSSEALRKALTNLANVFHEGRAVAAAPGDEGYVQSVIDAAEEALAPSSVAVQPPSPSPEPAAWSDVIAERRRQMAVEGWTPEHDDEHTSGAMSVAAACYALWAASEMENNAHWNAEFRAQAERLFQWDREWFKPKDKRRNLIRATALLLAEIERLDRASPPGIGAPPPAGPQLRDLLVDLLTEYRNHEQHAYCQVGVDHELIERADAAMREQEKPNG